LKGARHIQMLETDELLSHSEHTHLAGDSQIIPHENANLRYCYVVAIIIY
jgi:hypothetical protein